MTVTEIAHRLDQLWRYDPTARMGQTFLVALARPGHGVVYRYHAICMYREKR